MHNRYCDALGIPVPDLAAVVVRGDRDLNTYGWLILTLLEWGCPMTLREVAERLAQLGLGRAEDLDLSLRRCKPARDPVYREGDIYALDCQSPEMRSWVFRLNLRPRPPQPSPPPAVPLKGDEDPLTVDELKEAWRDAILSSVSAQRLAGAVLDAHGGPMAPAEVVAFIAGLTSHHQLTEGAAAYWRRGALIQVDEAGRWVLQAGHPDLRSARRAVRERLARVRAHPRTSPEVAEAMHERWQLERAARAAELARLRRVIVHAFPAAQPAAVVVLDVGERRIETFFGVEMRRTREEIARADIVAGLGVRALLRALGVEGKRVHELGPPQKRKTLNRSGRTLKITAALLIQGSCGISRPLGEESRLQEYLSRGDVTRLRRRLEADAKSLYALYQYARLHGGMRLHWGFLDEWIRAPWVDFDEPGLGHLKQESHAQGVALEVVVGSAPGWEDPWSRVCRCRVVRSTRWAGLDIVDEDGLPVDEGLIQAARLAGGEMEEAAHFFVH
jgi:hypothetical protein